MRPGRFSILLLSFLGIWGKPAATAAGFSGKADTISVTAGSARMLRQPGDQPPPSAFSIANNGALLFPARRKPDDLRSMTTSQLQHALRKSRRKARISLPAGAAVTALSIAVNIIGIRTYHGKETWGRLDGAIYTASALGVGGPAGTLLLISGFRQKGMVRQIDAELLRRTKDPVSAPSH